MACDNVFDSYPVSDWDSSETLNSADDSVGQAFVSPAVTTNLCKVEFYTRVYVNDHSKTIQARLYACTGTPGTDGVPTGSALAVSAEVVLTSPELSYSVKSFDISYSLAASTNYCILLWCNASGTSDIIRVGTDASSPTHAGNNFRNGVQLAKDTIFYLYSDESTSGWTGTINGITDPSHINGISVANISKVNGL